MEERMRRQNPRESIDDRLHTIRVERGSHVGKAQFVNGIHQRETPWTPIGKTAKELRAQT
jgi:hypothetical protein